MRMTIHINNLSEMGLFKKNNRINASIYKSPIFNQIHEYVYNYTNFLPSDSSFVERVHCLKYGIIETPVCHICGIPTKYRGTAVGYSKYCSTKCMRNDPDIKEQIQQTNIEKYGVDNPSKSNSIKEKTKAANIKKYGVDAPTMTEVVKHKIRATNKERYGVEIASQSEVVKNKTAETNLKKYGYVSSAMSPDVKERMAQNNLLKYGVGCTFHTEENKNKIKQRNLINFGVENPFASIDIQNRIKQTNLVRYGVENPAKSDFIKNAIKQNNLLKYGVCNPTMLQLSNSGALEKLQSKDYLINEHHTNKKSAPEIAEMLGAAPSTIFKYLAFHDIESKNYGGSYGQKQLCDFIGSIYSGAIITNKKIPNSNLEVDIYIPEYNIAIEYNGIFWHSELQGRGRSYHFKKLELCESNGIRLIQIWENEWLYKQDIVKSRLQSLFNKNDTIFARKCVVQNLTSKQATDFFNDTHIQGRVNASTYLGLIYNDEIVAAMSFGITRYSNEGVELLRYSSKLNTNIIGGAGKLLKYYIRNHNPSRIISYADLRWSTGELYKQLGFTFEGVSSPNYFYFKNCSQLFTRIQFQKHKLSDKLDVFDPNLSEWINMQNNGYNRIWDCGNSKWVLYC